MLYQFVLNIDTNHFISWYMLQVFFIKIKILWVNLAVCRKQKTFICVCYSFINIFGISLNYLKRGQIWWLKFNYLFSLNRLFFRKLRNNILENTCCWIGMSIPVVHIWPWFYGSRFCFFKSFHHFILNHFM